MKISEYTVYTKNKDCLLKLLSQFYIYGVCAHMCMCVYVLGFHLNCILIVDCSQNSLINPALGKRLLFISFIHRIDQF